MINDAGKHEVKNLARAASARRSPAFLRGKRVTLAEQLAHGFGEVRKQQ
jgi:hypothetical protein